MFASTTADLYGTRNLGLNYGVLFTAWGAAGIIGAQRLARAAPDGYTIGGISDSTVTYVPILQKRTDFDALNLFEPVSLLSVSSWVLVAHPSLPARNARELIALAKSRPGALNYGSAGSGAATYRSSAVFRLPPPEAAGEPDWRAQPEKRLNATRMAPARAQRSLE